MTIQNILALLIAFHVGFCISLQSIEAQNEVEWNTGNEFSKARNAIIGVSWSDVSLRESLYNLAKQQGVAIFLDRRVDPNQSIEFESAGRSLEHTIMALTDKLDLAALKIDNRLFYIGPRRQVAELHFRRTKLLKTIAELPRGQRSVWTKPVHLGIKRLDEPRRIIEALTNLAGIEVRDPEVISHDLWPEVDLPDLKLIDSMILLSYGFDRWPQVSKDGKLLRFNAATELKPVAIKHTRLLSDTIKDEIREEFPDSKFVDEKKRTTLVGTPEAHYVASRLQAKLTSRKKRPNDKVARTIVKSFNSDAKIESILRKVAGAMGVELEYDESMQLLLDARVQVSVENVSFEKLIEKALENTGLEFQVDSGKLIILRGN